MNTTKLRCLKCGRVYEKSTMIKGCPACNALEHDPVMFFMNDVQKNPIVPMEALLTDYPKVLGIKVTSSN